MSRALLSCSLLVAGAALGGTRFVGGGLEIGPAAPVFSPFADSAGAPLPRVTVSQILYTQQELGFAANTRIIDVAWRKEDLGPVTGAGGCALQVYLKNVTRQMGPFTVGSTQPLADALQNAQRVIDRPGGQLPSTMGFRTLAETENNFLFTYAGDGLETTIVTDCRGAAAPVLDAPLRWRYDPVPERVRVATGDTTDNLVLAAEPILSGWRPHTRFRTLTEQPGIELRVGTNVLANGGTFGLAANHLTVGAAGNFAFVLWNVGAISVDVTALNITNTTNGAGMSTITLPATVLAGQSLALPMTFTPVTTAQARFSITVVTSAGTQTNTFQGNPTATPTPQPAGAFERPDGTTQNLATATPLVVQLGNVPPGHVTEQTLTCSNYGHTIQPCEFNPMDPIYLAVTPPTTVGHQEDKTIKTRVCAPTATGPFTTEGRLTVGANVYTVRTQGTVGEPDLHVYSSADNVEIPHLGNDIVPRGDNPEPVNRYYQARNLGDRPLYLGLRDVELGNGARHTYTFARIIPPMGSDQAAFPMPALDLALEPFGSTIVSDDRDTPRYEWTTRSRSTTGGPELSVTFAGRGYQATSGALTNGAMGGFNANESFELTLLNVGDEVLVIESIAEVCERCASLALPPLALALEPGASYVLKRPMKEESASYSWGYQLTIVSNDPGSPFKADLMNMHRGCAMVPGPLLLGLLAWAVVRRRRGHSRCPVTRRELP